MTDHNQSEFRYYAFISYNSKDIKWGKRLQRKLEHFRIPSTLCSERGWKRKPINPVFFAPTDIQPGGLSEELKNRLNASKNLIVVCSPNSAQSEWVGKEIEYFHQSGRNKDILFFIVDGMPHSGNPETECFNPVVKSLGLPEILGANIHEKIFRLPWLNRERAFVQLISKLLGVEFDSIWKRHKRRLIAKTIGWILGFLAVVAAMLLIWAKNQPFDTTVSLDETSVHNPNLPPLQDAIITLTFDGETKSDTIFHQAESVKFLNIPHKYLGKKVRMTFSSQNFIPIDTTLTLSKNVTLKISRDPKIFGEIRKKLWIWKSERGAANTKVRINEWEVTSDSEGVIGLNVPLEAQKEYYIIEVPSWNVVDTVFMPCAEGQIIELE